MAGEISSSLNRAVSILSKERRYTNLGIEYERTLYQQGVVSEEGEHLIACLQLPPDVDALEESTQ